MCIRDSGCGDGGGERGENHRVRDGTRYYRRGIPGRPGAGNRRIRQCDRPAGGRRSAVPGRNRDIPWRRNRQLPGRRNRHISWRWNQRVSGRRNQRVSRRWNQRVSRRRNQRISRRRNRQLSGRRDQRIPGRRNQTVTARQRQAHVFQHGGLSGRRGDNLTGRCIRPRSGDGAHKVPVQQ